MSFKKVLYYLLVSINVILFLLLLFGSFGLVNRLKFISVLVAVGYILLEFEASIYVLPQKRRVPFLDYSIYLIIIFILQALTIWVAIM